jgi:PAS domain S-box-containing protein
MAFWYLSSLTSAIAFFWMGSFVLQRGPRDHLRWAFFAFCMLGAYVGFTEFMWCQAGSAQEADRWIRIGALWPLALAAMIHFLVVYTGHTRMLRQPLVWLCAYVPAACISIAGLTTNLICSGAVQELWGYTYALPQDLWLSRAVGIWTAILPLAGLHLSVQHYRHAADSTVKQQATCVYAGVLITVVITAVTQGIMVGWNVRLPEISALAALAIPLSFGYAMWRYDLFAVNPLFAAHNIFATMSEMLFMLDDRGNITAVNKAARDALGRDEEALLGRPLEELVATDAATPGLSARTAERPDFANRELRLRTAARGDIPVMMSTSLVRDRGGQVVGAVCVARDISERKAVENEVRALNAQLQENLRRLTQSEEHYRALVDTIPDIIYRVDPQGRFTFVSGSVRNLGYTPEELIGQDFRIIIHPDDAEFVTRTLVLPRYAGKKTGDEAAPRLFDERRRGERCTRNLQMRLVPKPGREAAGPDARAFSLSEVVEVSSVGLWRNGDQPLKFLGTVGVLRDVSERKRSEEEREKLQNQVRHMQKMEAIGVLAGGIAHDFNNLLGAIVGYADLTVRRLPEGSREHSNLRQILAATERAASLVRQILTFSRRSEAEQRPLDVAPLIKEALKLLRATLPATVAIEQQVQPNAGYIMGDATQVHQVLMNLCTNAAYAMREHGGALTVRLEQVLLEHGPTWSFTELRPGHHLRLQVSDTGVGMARATLDHLFEPFFTTKPPGEGTGMGLSVVHGIVQGHGGEIVVESTLGIGTTFSVYFPLIEHNAAAVRVPSASAVPRGSENVLLVDDEQALLDFLTTALSGLGYRVSAFSVSNDALQAFNARPHAFDLLITDQTMPGITGLQLAHACHAKRPALPVILCTGYSNSLTPEAAQAEGIAQVAMKPLDVASLGALVRAVLDGRVSA